jgi:hypothetical protein
MRESGASLIITLVSWPVPQQWQKNTGFLFEKYRLYPIYFCGSQNENVMMIGSGKKRTRREDEERKIIIIKRRFS